MCIIIHYMVYIITLIMYIANVTGRLYVPSSMHPEHETEFFNNVEFVNNQTEFLCGLSFQMKLAVCNYIITQAGKSIYKDGKYLSTTAHSLLSLYCEQRPIHFQFHPQFNEINNNLRFRMLRCYGRHDPIRTSWFDDDAFDTFYVLGGPLHNSLTVITHNLGTTFHKYVISAIVYTADVDLLSLVQRNRNDVITELASTKHISFLRNANQYETIYIMKRMLAVVENFDPICNLRTEKKIQLCEKIVNSSTTYEYIRNWKLDRNFFNDDSSICVEKPLYFQHETTFNGKDISQMMYPCYGTYGQRKWAPWYISGGRFENSVTVYEPSTKFMLFDENLIFRSYKIAQFYENFELEYLLNEYDESEIGIGQNIEIVTESDD